jgi:hypothetical protein
MEYTYWMKIKLLKLADMIEYKYWNKIKLLKLADMIWDSGY